MMALVCTASSNKMTSALSFNIQLNTCHQPNCFFKEVGSLGFLSFLEIIPLWYSLKDLFTVRKINDKVGLHC